MSLPNDDGAPSANAAGAISERARQFAARSWRRTEWLRATLLEYWTVLTSPSRTLSLGFLTIGGFLAGILFWGGFNTALEATNTEKFCVSCHEMRENVFEELKSTIHYSNRSGVRATCPDCHVPHNWTDKIGRKIQASKEVWGKIFGSISTREKFTDMRFVSTPERICIGGPEQKSITAASKKAPDIGGLLAFELNPEGELRV